MSVIVLRVACLLSVLLLLENFIDLDDLLSDEVNRIKAVHINQREGVTLEVLDVCLSYVLCLRDDELRGLVVKEVFREGVDYDFNVCVRASFECLEDLPVMVTEPFNEELL
jgi:hypothetical protein